METEENESSTVKQEKVDANEIESGEASTAQATTLPKPATSVDQQDPRKLLAAEINEKDIKAAAASALAAAAVKAKVGCSSTMRMACLNCSLLSFSI